MSNKFKLFITDYFGFNAIEIKGFVVLLFLLVMLLAVPFFTNFIPQESIANNSNLDSLAIEIEVKEEAKKQEYALDIASKNLSKTVKKIKLAVFDPNNSPLELLEQVGIPSWLAKRMIHYREKGGVFRKKEDVAKIYDFPVSLYQKIEPYILIPTPKNTPNFTKAPISQKEPVFFDLNTADTNDLKKIKGIGSKLSARIVSYRSYLGGFYAENQIREVWGLDSLVISELLHYGKIKSPIFRKIKINSATNPEELKHPYLKPYICKIILNYKAQHGIFKGKEDLLQIKVLSPTTVDKLMPYLVF